jgi:transcriptional regulator with XRE-family HTH domain
MPRTKTFGELVGREELDDPDFRAEWQRLAPAREFAASLLRYRAAHGLSQRALAARLGVSQPRVAALEAAERNPEIDTIIHAVRTIGIEFCFDAAPASRAAKFVTKSIRERETAVEHANVRVVAAAS